MAGLTTTGLTIKRLTDVIADNKLKAQEIFADLVKPGDTVDVSDNTALGRMIGIVAPAEATLWEQLELVYNSFSPIHATGIALDNIIGLSGIVREGATNTTSQVLITGDYLTSVRPSIQINSTTTKKYFNLQSTVLLDTSPCSGLQIGVTTPAAGDYTFSYSVDNSAFIDITRTVSDTPTANQILDHLAQEITSEAGDLFECTVDGDVLNIVFTDVFQAFYVTLSSNLVVNKVSKLGVVKCTETGPVVQVAGTINNIPVPYTGVDSITNPQSATTGSVLETDEVLRERWRNSKFIQASSILDAMVDALKNVDGVEDVIVYENDTDVVDSLGIDPHRFMAIVIGGVNTDIADAISKNKPLGIWSQGNLAITVLDDQGLPHVIRFQRPVAVPIYIDVEITDIGGIPADVVAQIKQQILDYAGARYLIGDDVIYSRFYTPINAVQGHAVNSLTIGTSPSPTGMANIIVPFDSVAEFDADYITVTVV